MIDVVGMRLLEIEKFNYQWPLSLLEFDFLLRVFVFLLRRREVQISIYTIK